MTILDIIFTVCFYFACLLFVFYTAYTNNRYEKRVYDYQKEVTNRLYMITTALNIYDGDAFEGDPCPSTEEPDKE